MSYSLPECACSIWPQPMSLESKRVMPFVQNLDPILHLDLCSKDVCIWKESNHYTNYKLKKSVACFFKLKFMARKSRRWIGPHVKTVWVVNLEFKIRIQIWSQNSDFCFRISALFSEVQVSIAEFRLFFFSQNVRQLNTIHWEKKYNTARWATTAPD